MRISIAMATYNGARFLQEQLDSFLYQTRRPDELVVCDDRSTDTTIDILQAFSQKAPFPVRVFSNQKNLGFSKNFNKVLSLCQGDVIFLSDQDDIWFNRKIEKVEACFAEHSETLLVVNDAEIVDERLNPSGLTVRSQTLSTGAPESDVGHGSAMALRSSLWAVAGPVPVDIANHDSWLNSFADILGRRTPLYEVLQYWRRHSENSSNWVCARQQRVTRVSLWRHLFRSGLMGTDPAVACQRRVEYLGEVRARIVSPAAQKVLNSASRDFALDKIDKTIGANRVRASILAEDSVKRVPRAIVFYVSGGYRHFTGFLSLLKDITRS